MPVVMPVRRSPAAQWVYRLLIVQTVAVFLWTLATFVLGLAVGMPWVAVVPLLLGVLCAWLTNRWGRLAEWVGPVLAVIEAGVLFRCLFAALVHGPTLGSMLFGGLAVGLLVLLCLPSSRARSGDLARR
jgi:hypothetical protein